MALPFLNGSARKKRTQIISVDMGARTTKAVFLEQRGEVWALCRYALLDAPIFDKKISPEMLTEHLKAVVQALETDAKFLTLSVGLDDAVIRQVELPQIPIEDMRLVLKNNTKGYLQQDLPGYIFDCYIFPPKQVAAGKAAETQKTAGVPKLKVLVTGAKQQLVSDYQAAIKEAGLLADHLVPGLICPINAFEMSMPEVYANKTVALVDIGFKQTSVCILDRGELALMRVVNTGGDKITAGLAESMSVSYAEAEGIKVGMALEVQSMLEMQVLPLGRELRASLDFFEHQHDRPVTAVYVSGGSAKSEMIRDILQSELSIECKTWNTTRFLQVALRGQQAVEIEHVGSQLTVAVGAALMAI
jgi:type IV pilus assembly protein PilM